MTESSERQRYQIWILPRCPSTWPKHRLTAPMPQGSFFVQQQRVGGEELFKVHELGPCGNRVTDKPHPEPGHCVVVKRAVGVVLSKPANAGCHDLLRCAFSMTPDRKPCEAQMIAVSELRVAQRQAKEGAQKLIVGEHGVQGTFLRKKN
jgi:hypothetical protein